ncbi:GntR family transcriptional regulator [Kitasatospora sp. MAP5-34]|uniref:GntR family transcriptional regulator n=1 Tax=Kitasatospora sp. MAP5-34 TaxID=3035102 RepID=UPI00247510BC|nr:GntR family transcriptional regulator [Kitasatospora sp. MAP5-34]MDH6574647.1 DNA-binding GntR family transcriptional regulator [Kitasatospora sp. MAP5-34]
MAVPVPAASGSTVPEPKYWHLRTVLVRTIDGEFSTGQVLPNERELAARFGVARATLRQALDQLELEGRLVRRRGIGTLIAAPRVGVPVGRSDEGWPSTSRSQSWRSVDCVSAPAPAQLARSLGIPAGETVHTVRRLRLVQGQIMAAESLHVPDSAVPRLPAVPQLIGGAENDRARSVLRQLERLGVDGESRSVELGVAEAGEAALLERPPGTPVLVVTTQYAAAGRLVALAVSTYRADTCKLTFGETGLVEVTPVEAARTA